MNKLFTGYSLPGDYILHPPHASHTRTGPLFRLADEESKDVRATLPQAYYSVVIATP